MITIPFSSYFETRSANATHSYNLRHCNRAEQSIIHRTKYALKSLQYRTPFVWNSIPDNLKCCEPLVSFKKKDEITFSGAAGHRGQCFKVKFYVYIYIVF